MPLSSLYKGVVVHRRLTPTAHLLRYRSTYCLFDVDELQELEKEISIFSLNRWNMISFLAKDLGFSTDDLKPQIIDMARSIGARVSGDKIKLLHMPRIMGFGFNPLTTYLFYNKEGECDGIIYEVNNTFGEKHRYAVSLEDANTQPTLKHSKNKNFYVSPFFPETGRYDFSVVLPDEKVAISIKLESEGKHALNASFIGVRLPFSSPNLVKHYLTNPVSGLKIISAIHWEALKLWLKGLPIIKRQNKETNPQKVSLEGPTK